MSQLPHSPTRPPLLTRLIREPLTHFVLLGALMFGWSAWQGNASGAGAARRVEVSPGVLEFLSSGFAKTWQRPPTPVELKGLVDEHVKEELAAREAMALGLDRDDTIIKRRLRQKLEFLAADEAQPTPATDAELRAWLDRHPEAFRLEPHVSLRQVYLRPDAHGPGLQADAQALLRKLRAQGAGANTQALSDASMLPGSLDPTPQPEVARTFGPEFAEQVMTLTPGQWSEPIESSYGLHLVWVQTRSPGARADLASVRPLIEREVQSERRAARLQAYYDQLLRKYGVAIARPASSPDAAADKKGPP